MFFPVRFKTSVQLSPDEMNNDFDNTIKTKLKNTLEGVCSRFGYVKQGSLDIVKRSAGVFTKQHFNGHIRFELTCRGEVCNPPQGLVVEGHVKNKNALGLLATSSITVGTETIPVLDIIVPRKSNGILSEIELDDVQIGDTILVMVMGKKYQLNDKSISIIGRAVKSRHAPQVNALAEGEEVVIDDDGQGRGRVHVAEEFDEDDEKRHKEEDSDDEGEGEGDAEKEKDKDDDNEDDDGFDELEEDEDFDDDDNGEDDDIYED